MSQRAFLIVDPPAAWSANPATAASTVQAAITAATLPYPGSQYAALYFPRIIEADPLHPGAFNTYAPSGTIAGIWRAPMGSAASGRRRPVSMPCSILPKVSRSC